MAMRVISKLYHDIQSQSLLFGVDLQYLCPVGSMANCHFSQSSLDSGLSYAWAEYYKQQSQTKIRKGKLLFLCDLTERGRGLLADGRGVKF